MTRFTVTFVYDHAIVSTDIEGNTALIERASSKIHEHIGATTDHAKQVIIHEHGKKKESHHGLL